MAPGEDSLTIGPLDLSISSQNPPTSLTYKLSFRIDVAPAQPKFRVNGVKHNVGVTDTLKANMVVSSLPFLTTPVE
jgi:hypothetical protein